MTRARYNQIPPHIRRYCETLSNFIRQCKTAGRSEEAKHWVDIQDGYLKALVDTETISEAESKFIKGD